MLISFAQMGYDFKITFYPWSIPNLYFTKFIDSSWSLHNDNIQAWKNKSLKWTNEDNSNLKMQVWINFVHFRNNLHNLKLFSPVNQHNAIFSTHSFKINTKKIFDISRCVLFPFEAKKIDIKIKGIIIGFWCPGYAKKCLFIFLPFRIWKFFKLTPSPSCYMHLVTSF